MHIVAIGWLYVTLLMAVTEESVVAGILTFLLYGLFPVAIILYLSASKRRKKKREAAPVPSGSARADRNEAAGK